MDDEEKLIVFEVYKCQGIEGVREVLREANEDMNVETV